MCMFCAAIPATAAIGAKLNADQRAQTTEAHDGAGDRPARPVKAVTAGLIVLLAVGSIVYHTHFSSLV